MTRSWGVLLLRKVLQDMALSGTRDGGPGRLTGQQIVNNYANIFAIFIHMANGVLDPKAPYSPALLC